MAEAVGAFGALGELGMCSPRVLDANEQTDIFTRRPTRGL